MGSPIKGSFPHTSTAPSWRAGVIRVGAAGAPPDRERDVIGVSFIFYLSEFVLTDRTKIVLQYDARLSFVFPLWSRCHGTSVNRATTTFFANMQVRVVAVVGTGDPAPAIARGTIDRCRPTKAGGCPVAFPVVGPVKVTVTTDSFPSQWAVFLVYHFMIPVIQDYPWFQVLFTARVWGVRWVAVPRPAGIVGPVGG